MRAFPLILHICEEPAWKSAARFLVRLREQCNAIATAPPSRDSQESTGKNVWLATGKGLWPSEMSWAITVRLNGGPCFPYHRITLDGSHFVVQIDIKKAFPLWGPIIEMTKSWQNIPGCFRLWKKEAILSCGWRHTHVLLTRAQEPCLKESKS